jgi:GntR family transcriptional regulator
MGRPARLPESLATRSVSPARHDWLQRPPAFTQGAGIPLHTQIEHWLTEVIGRGELVSGDRLPREADFAVQLGVSRMTLRQALATMESHGTVIRKTGRTGGTFVSEPRIECDLTGLLGFTEQMRRASVRAGARMVSTALVTATPAVANALSLPPGSDVYEVIRVRTARREPLALERAYFPTAPFPGLLDQRLGGSIYELLRKTYRQSPHTANEVLVPVAALDEEARLLQVAPGTPLLLIERTTFTSAGLAIEYARDLFRPDRVRISLQTGIGGAARAAQPKSTRKN